MSRRLVIGPFNRVEGDLEVRLDIADGRVASAQVASSLYRGFEQLLIGKHPLDALVMVPRICGICSVAQSAAAAAALADAAGLNMPANGRLTHNLILACENVADHLTHFYLFFMPDFARVAYRERAWHGATEQRFKATTGSSLADMLPARSDFLHIMGTLAGKWPHSLALQPGGTTRAATSTEKLRLLAVLGNFRAFLEKRLFGDALEAVSAIATPTALDAWATDRHSDLACFLRIADDLNLSQAGRATDIFLSHGAYGSGNEHLFAGGVWNGELLPYDQQLVSEDLSHAWMIGDEARHPMRGQTLPLNGEFGQKPDAYTWCKAPRYGGRVVETGALARQMVAGHPLLHALVAVDGGNVKSRVVARLLEIALVVPAMEQWVSELTPGEPFCHQWELPDSASGTGLVEAARGALGHWLRIEKGKIAGYQIIAPTTWNFSPRDADGVPGALEQALVGLPVGDTENSPPAVQHVVRSFDPCMVCTVH